MSSTNSLSLVQSKLFARNIHFSGNRRLGRQLVRGLKRSLSSPRVSLAVQELRDAVYFQALKKKRSGEGMGSVLGFTGVIGREGVTTLSLLMAIGLSELKYRKILFVDGSFDRQSFKIYQELFDLDKAPITCADNFDHLACYGARNKNFWFLTGSNVTPMDFFSNPGMRDLTRQLRDAFDFVVLDMPPLLTSSETKLVLSIADLCYLIVVPGRTLVGDMERCKRVLREADVTLDGVVMNRQRVPIWTRFIGRDAFLC